MAPVEAATIRQNAPKRRLSPRWCKAQSVVLDDIVFFDAAVGLPADRRFIFSRPRNSAGRSRSTQMPWLAEGPRASSIEARIAHHEALAREVSDLGHRVGLQPCRLSAARPWRAGRRYFNACPAPPGPPSLGGAVEGDAREALQARRTATVDGSAVLPARRSGSPRRCNGAPRQRASR